MLNSNLCHKTSLTCKYSHGLLSWSGHGRVVSICSAWEKNSSIFIKDKYYLKNHLLKRQIWIICIAKMPQQGGHSGLFGYRNSTPNGRMIWSAFIKHFVCWLLASARADDAKRISGLPNWRSGFALRCDHADTKYSANWWGTGIVNING